MVDVGTFIKQEIEKKRAEDAARAQAATIEERVKPIETSLTNQVVEAGIAIFATIPGITIERDGSINNRDDHKRSYFILNEGTEGKETKCQVQIDLFPGGKIELEMLEANGVTSKRGSTWNISEAGNHPLSAPQEVELRAADKQIAIGYSVLRTMGWWFAQHSPAFAEGFAPAMKLIQQANEPTKADAAKEAIAKLAGQEARSREPSYKPSVT